MGYNLLLGALGLLIGVSALLVFLIAAHQHRLKLLNQGITIHYGENIRKPFRPISIIYYLIPFRSISIIYYLIYPHLLFQAFMYLECLCIGLIGQNWYYNIVIAFFLLMTINPSVKIKRIFVFQIGEIGALVMAVFGIWLYYELFKLFIVAVITILLSVFLLRHRSNIIYLTETISILIIIIGVILGTLHKLNYINLV